MAKRKSTLLKFKRKWKGKTFFYFKHIASNGETIFSSPSYKTRGGRNKMVNKLSIIHGATIKNENDL